MIIKKANTINENNNIKQLTLEKEDNMTSRVITALDFNVQFSTNIMTHAMKEENVVHTRGKKAASRKCPYGDPRLDLRDSLHLLV